MRNSNCERNTKETQIKCSLEIDGEGKATIDSGIGFFDHMLNTLVKHSGMNMEFTCKGDINVDTHHTVEDSGIVIGKCFYEALGDRLGIARYSSFTMPMDDALVMCAIDICNRSYYESNAVFNCDKCGDYETHTTDEFFRSFADNAHINLHFVILRGDNAHHIIEAMFKALAKCLKDASKIDSSIKGSLSTKGAL